MQFQIGSSILEWVPAPWLTAFCAKIMRQIRPDCTRGEGAGNGCFAPHTVGVAERSIQLQGTCGLNTGTRMFNQADI